VTPLSYRLASACSPMLALEIERGPDFTTFATPLAWPGPACASDGVAAACELRARIHSGQIGRAARLPKDQKRTENIGGLMFRRPTNPAKGRQALKKGREFVRAFSAPTEGSPWTLKQDVDVVRERNKTSPNGSADGAHQDAGGGDLVAISVRRAGDVEYVPTPCVVLVAPGRQLPRNEQPVTNEGGLIRFGLGASNDREVRAKRPTSSFPSSR
jgi:hypothetical protein